MLGEPLLGELTAVTSTPRRCAGARTALSVLGVLGMLGVLVVAFSWPLTQPAAPSAVLLASDPTLMASAIRSDAPIAKRRCEWVVAQARSHNANKSAEVLEAQFSMQASSLNMYYRGVDYMFWNDFLRHGWGDFDFAKYTALGKPVVGPGGHEVQNEIIRTSAWTWITGDQHLSNFGAWRNRAVEVVFGVNDFDEAVIYDFQMDVWRLAVSIYDHAITNDYSAAEAIGAVVAFTEAYVATLEGYVGNEKALLFEMTAEHASGPLREFLEATASRNSAAEQLRVFTRVGSSGEREFIKNDSTKLAEVDPSVREEILSGWTAAGYGATLNKIGWHEIEFSPE